MAGVDPYAPCPCGSGQKFKWCCHKMEPFADRSRRLDETGQHDAAIGVLDEGLRKEPANAWLLIRKALIQIRSQKSEAAKATLVELVKRQPQHVGGRSLLIRCILETEGPLAAVEAMQEALGTVSEAGRRGLGPIVAIIGTFLARIGHYPAGLAHLTLARKLVGDEADDRSSEVEAAIQGDPAVEPWLKRPDTLAKEPAGLSPERASQFAEAVGWAESGLWNSAASAFEMLSGNVDGPEADRNLGLCRLWLAEVEDGVSALRRAIGKMGETTDAVDLEALCQLIEPVRADDKVERVQLIWPLRDRNAMLAALRAQSDIADEGTAPIDPDDPESPEVDEFVLLDRPKLADGARTGLTIDDLPRVLGQVAVGREIVALEGKDDGGLDALSARFTALADRAIAPAHPKTKVLGSISRMQAALSVSSYPPDGLEPTEVRRLNDELLARMLRDVWPETPMPFLGGRTPRQAARAGHAAVPLRAALCQFEQHRDSSRTMASLSELRAALGIAAEPEVDPETVELETLPLSRFAYLPVERLGDDRLTVCMVFCQVFGLNAIVVRAAREISKREEMIAKGSVSVFTIYREIANDAIRRGETAEAFRAIEEGRRVEPASQRGQTAVAWDLFEIGLKMRTEAVEAWVPELAVVLERYRDDPAASQPMLMGLINLGLVDLVPNPDKPGETMLDPRTLTSLMGAYGPRVTTASGQLGVSATKGGIWTPGAASGTTPGGIWTPGSGSPAPSSGGAEPPRLIIPGR